MHGQPQYSQLFGGHGGGEQQFAHNMNLCLVGAKGRCGASLDQIQFLFRDINTGQFIQTPDYGGRGGGPWSFQAPPGQWIDKVWVEYNKYVQSIKFATNMGTQSREYGGNGRGKGYYDVSGRRITGVNIRCGGLVDALTFVSV